MESLDMSSQRHVLVFGYSGFYVQYESGFLQDISPYHLFQRHWLPLVCNCVFHVGSHVGNGLVWFRRLWWSHNAINDTRLTDMTHCCFLKMEKF
jgi:hypothetical protein